MENFRGPKSEPARFTRFHKTSITSCYGMVGSGRRVRARGALPSREGLLIVTLGLWILMPGAESLFGFGGGKKKGASRASGAVTEVESTGASEVGTAAQEACIADMGTEKVGNAGMGKWEGADGKLHPIRAERRPSGLWEFPVGTVVPKVRNSARAGPGVQGPSSGGMVREKRCPARTGDAAWQL